MCSLKSFEFGAFGLQLFIKTRPFQYQTPKTELQKLIFAFESVGVLALALTLMP